MSSFTSNSKLLLMEIHVILYALLGSFNATVHLYNYQSKESLILGTVTINNDIRFILPFPIVIEKNVKYGIRFDCDGPKLSLGTLGTVYSVRLKGGVEIQFDAEKNIIRRLIFEHFGA